MSSIRGIGDGYAFQRLLWLLVGTVIVPTILLSLFGVAAIRNQGAAVLHELDRLRSERLEMGARTLADAVGTVEDGALERSAACSALPCALDLPGTTRVWAWRSDDQTVPPELQSAGISSELGRDGQIVWISPADGSSPVLVVANGTLRFAWRLDSTTLQGALDALVGERIPQEVTLTLTGREPGTTFTLDDLLTRAPQQARLDLPPPLSGWRLVLEDPEDSSRGTLTRNAWLYPASLVLLVGLVIVGTVVTLGSATREIRLSRLQTDFVSSVSHELRTPLTSIRLFVETLQSGRLQDQARVQECLDLLAHETDRLSRMIERVLDWARMEAGRRSYEFEPTAPHHVTSDALRALRSQHLLADQIEPIEVDVPTALPDLQVDRDAIVEALLNLLQNAVKHSPPPRRIALRGVTDWRWVGLVVEDNGPGIAKRDRKRIFEKFYQVDTRLSSPVQGNVDRGSGLGLSIVRAVARAHGGRVELETELGRGSRFTLWLPAVEVPR